MVQKIYTQNKIIFNNSCQRENQFAVYFIATKYQFRMSIITVHIIDELAVFWLIWLHK